MILGNTNSNSLNYHKESFNLQGNVLNFIFLLLKIITYPFLIKMNVQKDNIKIEYSKAVKV